MHCTYIYTSDWIGSCPEEGPFFEGASLQITYTPPEDILNGNHKQLRGRKGNTAHHEPIKIYTW